MILLLYKSLPFGFCGIWCGPRREGVISKRHTQRELLFVGMLHLGNPRRSDDRFGGKLGIIPWKMGAGLNLGEAVPDLGRQYPFVAIQSAHSHRREIGQLAMMMAVDVTVEDREVSFE